ncbi:MULTISPECIES: hypothetical protein [Neptunomonas]|uniref:Uncharacterized protein n=1 Tax=Neptunomonas marina TaxID=1815562 RepID=A0A437QE01_9GAMM|nr:MULTISPECIES: hypothetical protein [Neptunomonas]RVU32716.1 hypothetical protein EOE65_03410 [Neptunomonas marina]
MSIEDLKLLNIDQLKAKAEELGINYGANISEKGLLKKIADVLGEPLESDDADTSKPVLPEGTKYVEVMFPEDDKDTQPVQVHVNGRSFVMPRGEWHKVPDYVIEVLNNAKKKVYSPKDMKPREVLAYPFQSREYQG